MANFSYTARNTRTNTKVSGVITAKDEQTAGKLLIEQGLSPIGLKAKGESLSLFGNRIKPKQRIIFARQLATLINAGLPLVSSLHNLSEQTKTKAMKLVVDQIIADVEAGKSFSDALATHPKVFNNIFISLVKAGEASGTLDVALERLALQQEKDAEIMSKVRGAMVYPLIVILVMGGVVTFMMVAVLPQVQILYDGLEDVELPFITKALIAVSEGMVNYWWMVIIAMIVLLILGRRGAKTTIGRRIVDKIKIKVPPFSGLLMKLYMARFSRTASTLIASGVPLIEVLEIVSQSVNNVIIGGSIDRAIEDVKGGKSLADSLEGDTNFLVLVPSMLRIGEESGSIEQMLERSAEYYEKEVETQVKTISTIIEPILMVLLGGVAITIIAAILLPIYSLVGQNIIG